MQIGRRPISWCREGLGRELSAVGLFVWRLKCWEVVWLGWLATIMLGCLHLLCDLDGWAADEKTEPVSIMALFAWICRCLNVRAKRVEEFGARRRLPFSLIAVGELTFAPV